ncbi:MAG TPA: flagellar hook-associated protein FlgK [Marinospirillum sp.]|uniref:flagellar hook-associated protein FlgK n=1 Tax=Marinospirillum sp. TaxID=2183934 RepID=UPI002B479325|nr:flagellar hook-associated protein FlgK [Marinospirillum sp.]HKM15880.1 flagellar hook-associated protein FlgK [Marinospirillum sp.]
MSDLLSIGLSGLRTSRNNISVTGHNISNIDTPGFSRQRATQVTNSAISTGVGAMGTGARTQSIERIVDQYAINQVRIDTSNLKDNEAYLRNASELDSLLSNENSALGMAMNGLFEGIQSAANDPLSKPARQLVFSQLESVSQRFKTANSRLEDQNNNINTQARTYSAKINELSIGISQINKEVMAYDGGSNRPPNDLLDGRDELLRQLSEIVDVQVQAQDGFNINVSIGNGVPLIAGENVNKLEAVPSDNDKSRYEIYMTDNQGGKMNITNEIQGGEMGGLLRYRSDTLDPALNEMGRIAIIFAAESNNKHHSGTDLNGDQGFDLFKDINTKESQLDRIPGIQRTAEAGVWIDPENLHKLPAQEFYLKQQGNELVLADSVTGANMLPGGPFTDIAAFNIALQGEFGFKLSNGEIDHPVADISLAAEGVANLLQGGGMLISPTRIGASQLERSPELSDTNKIALAGIAAGENNAGTAKLGFEDLSGQKLTSFGAGAVNLSGAQVKYDGTNFTLTDTAGTTTAGTDTGDGTYTFAIGGSDLVLNISDIADAKTNDAWTLEGTAGGQNGKVLSALQQERIIDRRDDGTGGSSLSETYSMLVEDVGIRTSESRTSMAVSTATLNQSVSMRESASGVNMDEEAGNLIRFQQAYMASSQIISTAQKLFDTLIASVGR